MSTSSSTTQPKVPTYRRFKPRKRTVISFVLIAQIIGIVTAIDAVMTSRTSQGAIAWGTTLVMFPYVAVPAYWIFGGSEFEDYAEITLEKNAAITQLLDDIRPQLEATFIKPTATFPEYDALVKLSQLGLSDANHLELLVNGEATYDSMLEGIRQAENYILLQSYTIHADGIGTRIRDALIERAAQGVRVYVVYDEVGSMTLPGEYKQALSDAGVQIHPFDTTQGLFKSFQLNFRNHRKIMVIDGQSAWLGGLNIGDEYLGMDPRLSPWRDTHLRIDGPGALQAQVSFLADWYWATRELIEVSWEPVAAGDSRIMMIASSPVESVETATLFFTHAINSARERIWISTPYFVPDIAIINALRLAEFRGVDVQILIPSINDSRLVKEATYFYVQQFSDTSIRFHEYQNGFLHQKVMLIDEDTATVGSANFDNRSFRLNFEVTALVHDVAFAQQVEQMLIDDMAASSLLDYQTLADMSYWQHIKHRVARLFAPIL